MALVFNNKREDNYQIVTGVGTITVTVDFVPNFIDVALIDVKTAVSAPTTPDTVVLAAVTMTGVNTYEIDFDYNVGGSRTVKWVVAKLPVNPEQTISF